MLALIEHRSSYALMNGVFYRAFPDFYMPVMLDEFLEELQFALRQGKCHLHSNPPSTAYDKEPAFFSLVRAVSFSYR